MSQETELKQLLKQEAALLEQLCAVRVTIKELQTDIVFAKYRLVANKTILTDHGKIYRFSSIDRLNGTDKPWVWASPVKKDSTFGKPTRRLFNDWEMVK